MCFLEFLKLLPSTIAFSEQLYTRHVKQLSITLPFYNQFSESLLDSYINLIVHYIHTNP